MIKKLSIILFVLFCAVSVFAADSALQVDFILAGYRTPTTDEVLSGGKIYTYLDGTSTLSALWTDKDKVGTATNPFILDSSGKAEVFGDNIYKMEIYDSDDVLIETLNGLQYKASLSQEKSLDSEYNCDLPTALAALGAVDSVTLIVDCDCIIADGTTETITDNISTNIINGGSFDGVAGGGTETLNINGSLIAGPYKIFGENLILGDAPNVEYGYAEWFGIDGLADEIEINKALDFTNTRLLGKTYSIDSPILITKDFRTLSGIGEESLIVPTSPSFSYCIWAYGDGYGLDIALTADGDIDDTVVSVADASGFAADDIVRLTSEELLLKVDDTKLRYMSELARIKSISGNDITLFTPLYFPFLISENATIKKVSTIKNPVVKDLSILRDNEASGGQGSPYTYGIDMHYAENPVIESVHIEGTTSHGTEFLDCYNPRISNSIFLDCYWPGTGLSYGAHVSGSRDILIENCYFDNGRHCVSFGGLVVPLGALVTGCTLNGISNDNYAADSHMGAELKWADCKIIGGIVIGPPSVSISNCELVSNGASSVVNARGIAVSPEFGRNVNISGSIITWNGTDTTTGRGPIYLSFTDETENSEFIMTGTKIYNYAGGASFSVGCKSIIINDSVIKSQNDPVPSLIDFYAGMAFNQAKVIKFNNTYIEGGFKRDSTSDIELIEIIGSTFYNSSSTGIIINGDPASPTGKVIIKDTEVLESFNKAITIQGIDTAIIDGVTIETTQTEGSLNFGIQLTDIVNHMTVINNYVNVPVFDQVYVSDISYVITEKVENNNFPSYKTVYGTTGAGVAPGVADGWATTTNDIDYQLNGLIFERIASSNRWDFTGLSTGAGEFKKILLCFDDEGLGEFIEGPIATSQIDAILPDTTYSICPVGIVEIPENYAGGSLLGFVFYDIIGSFN